MQKYTLLSLLSLALPVFLQAQITNCTVNAGIGNGVFCAGDVIKLDGNVAGNVVPGTLKWEQVGGGPAAVLQYANQLQAKAIPSGQGTYTFKISATCASGMAEQTVTHTVEPKDSPDAGADQTVACYQPGGVVLTGFSIPPSGTLANWEASGGLGSVQGGVFKLFEGVCFSSPQTFTLTYVVENANHCKYTDTKKLTINQAQEAVFAKVFGGCGASYSVLGSCTGAGTGTWSFVSPALGASFTSPTSTSSGFTGLTPGKSYTVRWTVTGGCNGNGSADVSFTYPLDNTAPTSADITNLDQLGSVASGGVFMCGVPDSLLLFGSQPNPAAHEKGTWKLYTQPCDPFLGTNNFPPAVKVLNDYTALVLNQGPGAFSVVYQIIDTLRGCYTKDSVYFELETPGSPVNFTTTYKSCGGKELSPYNYGCNGISVTDKVWDPQDVYSTYPISFHELPDPGNNLRYNLKSGSFSAVAGPPGNPPQIQGGNCLNYTLHDFEYVLALHNSAPSGTYVYNIPMVYGKDISPCGNPTATIVMEVSTPPEPSNAGSDLYICDNQTSLAGNTVATPQWFLIKKLPANAADPTFSNVNNKNTDVGGLSPGATYWIGYRSYGGIYCKNITDTVVVRTAQTAPTAPTASSNLTNPCFGMPITLSATPNPVQPGTSGRWRLKSPAGGSVIIKKPNEPITSVEGLAASTTYVFEYIVKYDCKDSLTSTVTVTTNGTQGPGLPYAGKDICLALGTTSINLNGSAVPPGMTGQWVSVAGNPSAATFANANNAMTTATVSVDGNYRFVWQVGNATCGAVADTIQATLSAPALAKIVDPYMVLCNVVPPVNNVTLTAQSPSPGTGVWTLYDGPTSVVITTPNSPTTTLNNLNQGAYRFYWSVSNGACSNGKDSISVFVGVMPPIATVGQNTVTLCGTSKGELDIAGNDPGPFLGFWTVEPVSPNIMSAGIDSYLTGSLTTPNAKVKLRPGKTRLRWNIIAAAPCAAAPSVADMVVDYVPTAQTVPNQDTIHVCNAQLVTLNAISPGSAGVGTWTKTSGPAVSGLPKTQQDNAPLIVALTGGVGVYKFKYEVTSTACPPTSDLLTVINDSIFTAPFLGNDTSFCVAGADLVLKGSNLPAGAFIAEWKQIKGAGGTFLPNANAQEVTFGPVQNDTYVFQYKVTNGGCAFVDFITDTVTVAQPFAGPDTIVCATSVNLTPATGGKKWKAQPNNPSLATIGQTSGQVAGMTVPGDYFFAMDDPDTKCTDIVKVSSKPFTQVTQEPIGFSECVGGADTLKVKANNHPPGMSYQWQVGNAVGGPFVNSGLPVNTVGFAPSSATPGTYFFRAVADNGACKDTSTVVQVKVLPPVQMSALPVNISICPNEKDTLSITAMGGQPPFQYTWESSASPTGPWTAIPGAVTSSYILPNQTPGIVYYRATGKTTGSGCLSTTSAVKVTVKTPPMAIITPVGATTICEGGSVPLGGSTGAGYSWKWKKDGVDISGATNSTYSASVAGAYTLVTTLDGCSNTSTPVQITVNQLPSATITAIGNSSLCAGSNDMVTLTAPTGANLTYQWYLNNNLIPGATNSTYIGNQVGSYMVLVTNSLTNCKSTSNPLQVSQSSAPTANIVFSGNPVLCEGDTLPLNGNNGTGFSYQWLLNGSPLTGATNQMLEATIGGNYALVIAQNGCKDTSSVLVVTVKAAPAVSVVSSLNIPFCEGLKTTLSTNTAFQSYKWSNGKATPMIQVDQVGNYSVTVFDNSGCTNTASFSISSVLPAPTVSLNGKDTLCLGENTTITLSTNANQFVWNDGNISQKVRNLFPSGTGSDLWWVVATAPNGCTKADSLKLVVKQSPNVQIAGDPIQSVCQGQSITLTASGFGTSTWVWNSNPSLDQPSFTIIPTMDKKYWVVGTNSAGCSKGDTVLVEVHVPPIAIAGLDKISCKDTITLSGNLPVHAKGQWIAVGNADVQAIGPKTAKASNLEGGENHFIWQVITPPCTETASDEVVIWFSDTLPVANPDFESTLNDKPVSFSVKLNDNLPILPSGSFLYNWNWNDPNAGVWTLKPDGSLTFEPENTFDGIAVGSYRVHNSNCPEDSASAKVQIAVSGPDKTGRGQDWVLTPGTDGKNDDLIFPWLDEFPKAEITIINRWGSEVYHADPYQNGDWKGKYKGSLLPEGTYFYYLNLNSDKPYNVQKGSILLLYED